MIPNYTIYQQALDLQASSFDNYSSITIGVGVAKFLQILLPQLAYVLTASIFTPQRLWPLARWLSPGRTRESQLAKATDWTKAYQRLQGFFVWKLACDLGFFLIVTEYGSWLRAFTFSGLFTYTVFQFLVYYLIGQRLILANLVKRQPPHQPRRIRTTWWKNLGAKLFYEEMGVTISQVNGSLVIAKMLVDYGAMWITWSFYTVGFFLFANGSLGFSPLFVFPHVSMISLYLSIYLGYAAMFTLFEIVLRNIALRASMPRWVRKLFLSTQLKQVIATLAVTMLLPLLVTRFTMSWKVVGELTSRLKRVPVEWRISLEDNPPIWKPNQASKTDCDVTCLRNMFKQGPYFTRNQ